MRSGILTSEAHMIVTLFIGLLRIRREDKMKKKN